LEDYILWVVDKHLFSLLLMPITTSAKKALKRSLFLRDRNAQYKVAMKRAIKALRKGVLAGTEKNALA